MHLPWKKEKRELYITQFLRLFTQDSAPVQFCSASIWQVITLPNAEHTL
jgi:hypothetical protein